AVITGTSISGRVTIGDDLHFYPSDITARVRGLQVHSSDVELVEAGHRTAINLQGLDKDSISRGMVAASPGSLISSYMLDCDFLYLAANEKPLKHRARVRVHLGTAEKMARISLLEGDTLRPGEQAAVQLLFEEEVAVWPGDRYVVRSYSPVYTIGGGAVLSNLPLKKRKRASDADRQNNGKTFDILRNGSVEEKVLLFLEESKARGIVADELGIRLGLFGKHLKKALTVPISAKKMVVVDSASQRYLATSTSERIKGDLLQRLERYHKDNPLQTGPAKEELRSATGRQMDARVFQFCLGELVKKGEVVQEESLVRLASHQVALQADEKQLRRDLEAWYGEKGLATATVKETMEHFADYPANLVREVQDLLIREELLLKISESLYCDAQAIDRLRKDMVEFITREGEIDAPRFKNLTGLTRKFSIPLLEYFDRIKLTIRIGDKRVLRKKVSS
ncbi:MAG: SelB C-terminal domain-containing protein, partial [Thermodesulfobacteriota bacterium]